MYSLKPQYPLLNHFTGTLFALGSGSTMRPLLRKQKHVETKRPATVAIFHHQRRTAMS